MDMEFGAWGVAVLGMADAIRQEVIDRGYTIDLYYYGLLIDEDWMTFDADVAGYGIDINIMYSGGKIKLTAYPVLNDDTITSYWVNL